MLKTLLVLIVTLLYNLLSISGESFTIPDIVHQIYDYPHPNFFLFLSICSVQRFHKPARHILWVNDEGRYRRGQWEGWQRKAADNTWEKEFVHMINNKTIEVQLTTFPLYPPLIDEYKQSYSNYTSKDKAMAANKAHRSDFMRMKVLYEMGGIYLDTDVFLTKDLNQLRVHDFVLSYDNIVNDPNSKLPNRLNNGILLSRPRSLFLARWIISYHQKYHPESFDFDSSVVPYTLAMQYPDLVHLEMFRIAPMSFAFQTNLVAHALACGIFVKDHGSKDSSASSQSESSVYQKSSGQEPSHAIWYPRFDFTSKIYTYENTQADDMMFYLINKRLALHLTMTHVRGICMMRKNLHSPEVLRMMPSYLGHLFRVIYYGHDDYDYDIAVKYNVSMKNQLWKTCRDEMGMFSTPDSDSYSAKYHQEHVYSVSPLHQAHQRQQYTRFGDFS